MKDTHSGWTQTLAMSLERLTNSDSNAHGVFKEFANNIRGMEPLICQKDVECTISTSTWLTAMATLGKQN